MHNEILVHTTTVYLFVPMHILEKCHRRKMSHRVETTRHELIILTQRKCEFRAIFPLIRMLAQRI